MLRLGLGFFVLLSTAVYGAGITANMIQAKEVEGEVPSLEEAKSRSNRVSVCTHSVFEESLEPHWNDKILAVYLDTWEEVLKNLNDKKCSAALLEEEAWNTFRSRGELCGFYKEPTAEFYMPTGVVVSKRAYRTLEPSDMPPLKLHSSLTSHGCPDMLALQTQQMLFVPTSTRRACHGIRFSAFSWWQPDAGRVA